MGEKWMDAFSKWPAGNQLVFSGMVVAACVLVLFLFGLWAIQIFRYIAIARHGWPDEDDAKPARQASSNALPVVGRDWREEQRQMMEEQAWLQQQMSQAQEEMEQSQEKSKNPCTREPSAGHTNMGIPKATVAKEVPPL